MTDADLVAKKLAEIDDDNLREDFFRNQVQISEIMQHDVMQAGGPYTMPEGCLRARSKNASKCRLT